MRKLSNSTPTVINTELRPFDESFRIDANGQLEQWFYDNTSQYVPNRTVTVLTLTPVLSVYDADTDKSYTTASTQGEEDYIAFYYLQWYVNEYNGTTYQETLITSSADGAGVDYFTQGNNLIVKKNVSYAHAVTIRCVATYIDPRDAGITYSVEDSVILSCSRDATVVLPEVAIVSPSARSFNPLVDGYTTENGVEVQNTEYEFEGTVTNSPAVEHVTSSDLAEYKVDGWGTEEIESASGSCSPTLTIRYPDGSIETDARFMYRKTADGTKLDVNGNAFITNLKGETVAWNQIIPYNTPYNNVSQYFYAVSVQFTSTSGHKLYVNFEAIADSDGKKNFVIGGGSSFLTTTITANLTASNYQVVKAILSPNSTGNMWIKTADRTGIAVSVRNQMVIDLTLIYGVGNEPTTTAAFEADYLKWFGKPLTYETYDKGSLKPVKMLSMKTVGFNAADYDEIKVGSENYAYSYNGYYCKSFKLLPNTTYRIRKKASSYGSVVLLINSDSAINSGNYFDTRSSSSFSKDYTTNSSGLLYVGVVSGTSAQVKARLEEIDLQIYLINDDSRNGHYESHWHNKSMLNVTEIKGRVVTNGEPTGNLVTIFPNGLLRARSVRDEIYVENGKIYAVKRVGRLNLGSVTYRYVYGSFYYGDLGSKPPSATTEIADFKMPLYPTGTQDAAANGTCYGTSGGGVYIKDSARGTDPDAFKTAMNGVYLHYRLNTPVTYEIDEIQSPFIFKWFGINSSGQEVDATTMPWYKEGQDTSKLKVDAMYGENINVVLRCTKGAGLNELSPSKAFASLSWRVPEIDCHVISYNGGAVRVGDDNDELTMRFGTTINVRGQVLSEARRNAHLRLNWKYRHSNSPEENDVGWDNEIEIPNNNLIHVRGTGGGTLASTLVYPYVYLLGPWKPATSTTTPYTKPTTTKDGASYERTID